MDTFVDYCLLSERKTDPFYAKKILKEFSRKLFWSTINGKTVTFIIIKPNNKRPLKRYRERCSVGKLVLNTPYSINRKYRLKTMQPAGLVRSFGDDADDDDKLIVHEQIISNLLAKNPLKSKYYTTVKTSLVASLNKSWDFGNINSLILWSMSRKKDIIRQRRKELNIDLNKKKEEDSKGLTVYTGCPASAKSGQKTRICTRKHDRINYHFDDYSLKPDPSLFLDKVESEAQSWFSKEFSIQEFLCQCSEQGFSKEKPTNNS